MCEYCKQRPVTAKVLRDGISALKTCTPCTTLLNDEEAMRMEEERVAMTSSGSVRVCCVELYWFLSGSFLLLLILTIL